MPKPNGTQVSLSVAYPSVVFSGEHPGSAGEVTTRCERWRPSLASCLFPLPGQRLLVDSFGVWRWSAMAARFGESCHVLSMYNPAGQCLFAMLLSAEPHVREIWGRAIERAGCDPRVAFDGDRILMDFVAIPKSIRGRVMHYLALAGIYVRFCGYSGMVSECQELRQLVLWLRNGVQLLNQPPYDPYERLRRLAQQRRRATGKSVEAVSGLRDGGRPFATEGNLEFFLPESVYFTYDLDGEVFARLTQRELGTGELGLRLAEPDLER